MQCKKLKRTTNERNKQKTHLKFQCDNMIDYCRLRILCKYVQAFMLQNTRTMKLLMPMLILLTLLVLLVLLVLMLRMRTLTPKSTPTLTQYRHSNTNQDQHRLSHQHWRSNWSMQTSHIYSLWMPTFLFWKYFGSFHSLMAFHLPPETKLWFVTSRIHMHWCTISRLGASLVFRQFDLSNNGGSELQGLAAALDIIPLYFTMIHWASTIT